MSDQIVNVPYPKLGMQSIHKELRFFEVNAQPVAVIGSDGIMRFKVDATDENAKRFVECIEKLIGRRLAGIEVEQTQ